jgi:hypothetical protein
MSTILRGLLGCLLIVTLIGSTMAADSGVAMLYTNGTAWINETTYPSRWPFSRATWYKPSPTP